MSNEKINLLLRESEPPQFVLQGEKLWIYCNCEEQYTCIAEKEINKLLELAKQKIKSYENAGTNTKIILEVIPPAKYKFSINGLHLILIDLSSITNFIAKIKFRKFYEL